MILCETTTSALQREISDFTVRLHQLAEEQENLLKHFQIQDANYNATFTMYENKVEALLKVKDEPIEKLSKEKYVLEKFFVKTLQFCSINFMMGLKRNTNMDKDKEQAINRN